MAMYFFTDLDRTLIYSHRQDTPGERVWVEKLDGRDQSFMTEYTYNFFLGQMIAEVIPVTTRNFTQYERLRPLAEKLRWKNALICNGAVLLTDNREDSDWTTESERIAAGDIPEVKKLYKIAADIAEKENIVNIRDLMFYTKSADSGRIYSVLSAHSDGRTDLLRDGGKVYCVPKSLNKGAAVERYMLRFGRRFSVSAGDSLFDVPMFCKTDVSLYPKELSEQTGNLPGIPCGGVFAEEICKRLEALCKEGIIHG